MIEPKNLLIVRTDRIGDVVLTLPVARIIKNNFPSSRISFLVKKYTAPLTLNNTYIDQTLILEQVQNKTRILKNVKVLKAYNFDTCIVAYPTFKTALIVFLAGIKNRIGTGYRWYSFLFNIKLYEHRKTAEKHELEYNINLLKFINIKNEVTPENVQFDLLVDIESELKIQKKLLELGINNSKKIVIIHPGSGKSAVDLPLDKFKLIVESITSELDFNVVLTGMESEKEICDSISNGVVINTAGMFNLQELTALIDKSDLLITNSTGPIHIAAALNKNVIGFYPKIKACSQERWGPYTNKKIIFTPTLNCDNCTREQCEKLNCMATIDVSNIMTGIRKILNS